MLTPSTVWMASAREATQAQSLHPSSAERHRVELPMLARTMALLHTAIYDTWAAYDPVAHTTVSGLVKVENASPDEQCDAMHMAACLVLRDQFPAQHALLNERLTARGLRLGRAREADRAEAVATAVATTRLELAHADGALQFGVNTGSVTTGPYRDIETPHSANLPLAFEADHTRSAARAAMCALPGRWRPLLHADRDGYSHTQAFLASHWHQVRPFALRRADQVRPAAPCRPRSQAFLDQARHLVDLQASMTAEHRLMAAWWTHAGLASSPVMHWLDIAMQTSQRDHHSVATDAQLFFALGNALHDAAIAAWNTKQHHDYCRPVSAIRHLLAGQALRDWHQRPVLGEAWRPFQPAWAPSPASPEYCAEVPALSTAAAEVLKRFTRSDQFTAHHVQRGPLAIEPAEADVDGLMLNWDSYTGIARQAGVATLYGGIQFYEGQEAGLSLGQQVGLLVMEKAQRYWLGDGSGGLTATPSESGP